MQSNTTSLSLKSRSSTLISTGLAIFSMFFGAGNIVFPLALGLFTQDKNFTAVLGMLLTAVLVPLMGLFAMLLYEGDYKSFFQKAGKIPGFIITLLILGLIGPLGGIPRCITISFSTLSAFGNVTSWASLTLFSFFSCATIFLFTFRPNRILPLMGYVLTPILLLSLCVIVLKGIFSMPAAGISSHTVWQTFSHGFVEGYNTMDLLAAFFFSSVVLACLPRGKKGMGDPFERRSTIKMAGFSALIAASLLALVYICFSYLAAGYSESLKGVPSDLLLGSLAYRLLGPYAGLVAGVAVSFACLTTEIALTAVFSEFVRKILFKERISHTTSILCTLGLSFLVSTLRFQGISAFLVPILEVCYPALIALTLGNICHKLFSFNHTKSLFYAVLALSTISTALKEFF